MRGRLAYLSGLAFGLACVTLVALCRPAVGSPPTTTIEFAHDGAWCWFGDPRTLTHEGEHRRTYAGWVTSRGDLQVGSYDHDTGRVDVQTVRERFQQNDHASPALVMRSDGRLVVFYSGHRGDRVYYRESLRPEDITSWGEEQMTGAWIDGGGGYTYPNVLTLGDERGETVLFFRGPSYQPSLLTEDEDGQWDRGRVLIEGHGERPYVKFESDGRGAVDIAFTDGHPRLETGNSIRYARLTKDGFFGAGGRKLGDPAEPLPWQLADVVYDGDSEGGRAWIWDIALDADGRPVIVFAAFPGEMDHRYRYALWDGGVWRTHEITRAGPWFPGAARGEDRFEPHYSGGIALDHCDPSVVYLSREVDGVFEIERWKTGDGGITWSSTPITANSDADNVRPCVPRGHGDDGPQVLWMRGDYQDYTDYHTAVVAAVGQPASLSGAAAPITAPPPASLSGAAAATTGPPPASLSARTVEAMKRAFNWQMEALERDGVEARPTWIQSVFMIGVMAAYRATGDADYLEAALSWSEANNWSPGPRGTHADDQCCTQVYLDIWSETRDSMMIGPTIQSFDAVVDDPGDGLGLWPWCDALFMAPPAMAALSSATGDAAYLDIMDEMWWKTNDLLYDPAESLFYRDESAKTRPGGGAPLSWRGNPIFWSRGNGWVLGGIARVLESMPSAHPSRPQYERLFRRMATRLSSRQGDDGLWGPSLLDPREAQPPETSGSGLFCYGMAWGINKGLLERGRFVPVVTRAWDGLLASLREDGRMGWVQPAGVRPALAGESDSAPYGTGAFLLAGSEVLYLERSLK